MRRIATAVVAAATAAGVLLSGGAVVGATSLGSPVDATPADATPASAQRSRSAGGFEFLTPTEDGASHPVTWDHCTPIHYVVRPDGAPAKGPGILLAAIADMQALTGLEFVYDGETGEAPSRKRPRRQPERYGDGWAPVLIAWSDPAESGFLRGTTVGRANISWTEVAGRRRYVTGQVVLDAPQLSDMLARADGWRQVRAVVLHELGHLVGLDHVDDSGELMMPDSKATEFGPGDLAGLRRLAAVPCASAPA